MPYQNLVNDLNKRCDFTLNGENCFEYALDGEKLFRQVQYAMSQKTTEARDNALKNVILYNFVEDGEAYFDASTRFNIFSKTLGFAVTNEQEEKQENMYKMPQFYDHYLRIVTEMVKDIDPNHEVKPFFGLTEQETIDMHTGIYGSFTSKDAWKYEILEVNFLKTFYGDIDRARETIDTKEVYDYTKLRGDGNVSEKMAKGRIESVYMLKKILEEELEAKGWWWRVRNYFGRAKEMRDLIKAADKTLKLVKFPPENGPLVESDYENEYIHPDEKDIFISKIKQNYAPILKAREEERLAKEEKLKEIDATRDKDVAAAAEKDLISKLFDPRFRPPTNSDELNDQIRIGNQLSKVYVHGNTSLDPAAKKFFNANMKKIIDMKEHMAKYADPALNRPEDVIQKHFDEMIDKFDKAERELIYNNPGYVPVTVEDVDKAMTVREPIASTVEKDLTDAAVIPETSKPVDTSPVVEKDQVASSK